MRTTTLRDIKSLTGWELTDWTAEAKKQNRYGYSIADIAKHMDATVDAINHLLGRSQRELWPD